MKKILVALFLVVVAVIAAPSHAAVVVTLDPGTTNVTTALTGYSTTGAMMDGMQVTAFFSSGGSDTQSWADTGVTSGGVSGAGWSLSELGDTFGGNWTLTSQVNITRLLIDAGPGDSVFDTDFGGAYGTNGSARGWTFDLQSGATGLDLNVFYRDQVALSGSAPVGDLYRYLDVNFSSAFSGSMVYIADTDNLKFAGDIQPIPEPGTMMLLGSGLVGLAGFARKRFLK